MSFGIGQPVRRTEDPRFLKGSGKFLDDMVLPRQVHGYVLHATHASAELKNIDVSDALASPGILLVLTGEDARAAGLGGVQPEFMPEDMGGPPGQRTSMPVLAQDRVRFVGERVAFVVAETAEQARDGAEKIRVDYADLPLVTSAVRAVAEGAPQIYPESPNNTCFTVQMGNAEATAAAFEAAHHVTKLSLQHNRLTATTLETRGTIGDHDASQGRTVLYSSTQNPHGVRRLLADHIFHEPETRLRVIARDVGGGFGMKSSLFPEEALVVWASRLLQRPVKWVAGRADAMLGDYQGRDQSVEGELALDENGKILAIRWRALFNMGAYIVGAACVPPLFSLHLVQTVYEIPEIDVSVSAVFTNIAPLHPYRGAGRPETIYLVERLIDAAAREMGLDPTELRRRNFIAPDAMPYETRTHFIYDSGEFATVMEKCLDLADWQGFEARRRASQAAGLLRGRGLSYYIDDNGIFNERMEMRFDPSGALTIVAGTFSHGQGHETVYAQMASDWLGVPFEDISLVQGDTAAVSFGRGTYASRSMTIGGSALRIAADEVIEKGKRWAGHLLEADPADIEFAEGTFTIAGTDKSMPLTAVAQASYAPVGMPIELGVGLEGTGAFAITMPSFPNGCHICEVEVDPETGKARIERFTMVDDLGKVINPLLAKGQIMGGVTQGIGQALFEDVRYDEDSGQLLSGSLLDYCLPRADDLPAFDLAMHEVPCKSNPNGVKGAGEGGAVGATPAVINAVLDALAPLGVTQIELPATPERIWRAIAEARK